MTAGTQAYVYCDDPWDGAYSSWCRERIEEGRTKAQARAVARKAGWLVAVHLDGQKPRRPSLGMWDYCPRHRPGKPQEAKTDD